MGTETGEGLGPRCWVDVEDCDVGVGRSGSGSEVIGDGETDAGCTTGDYDAFGAGHDGFNRG